MESFYVLRFDRTELTSGVEIGDEDVEAVFEVVGEVRLCIFIELTH